MLIVGLAAINWSLVSLDRDFAEATNHPIDAQDRHNLDEREQIANYTGLTGQRGIATTDLIPGGRAEFDGEPVDVVTAGDAVSRGSEIEVIEARSNRVVVRAVRG